jgi:small subunit ribosomal protein S6
LRDYELVLIMSPGISDENLPGAIDKVSQFITGKGGAITEVAPWGRRKLAYPIKRFMEGNYVLTRFKSDAKLIKELDSSLRLSEEVLRHLIVKQEA